MNASPQILSFQPSSTPATSISFGDLYPALKSGLLVISLNESEFYVGEETEGLYMPSAPYLPLIRACDGSLTISELAICCDLSFNQIENFVRELMSHNFIELRHEVAKSPNLNLLQNNFLERLAPERGLYTWRNGVSDGGFSEISTRKPFAIAILSENKLARFLLSNLQASGFSQTRISAPALDSQRPSRRVSATDVCGIFIDALDIGKKITEIHQEIARKARWGKIESIESMESANQAEIAHAQLAITTGISSPAVVQNWLSEGVPHLQISQPTAHTLEIGPLVLPGANHGACLNCVNLHRQDHLPPFIRHARDSREFREKKIEITTSSASFAAGVITSYICEFAIDRTSSLLNHSLTVNLLAPLEDVRHHYWNIHPECGCSSSNALV